MKTSLMIGAALMLLAGCDRPIFPTKAPEGATYPAPEDETGDDAEDEAAEDAAEDYEDYEGPGGYYDAPDEGGGERVGETDEASTPDR